MLGNAGVPNYFYSLTATLAKEVRKLSIAEKIRLAEDLWDDVAAHGDELPVPKSHQRLLDARLAAHLKSPDSVITLEEFRRRLARRL
ncbi:MAG: addiction module protein [Verrucomicrobia bacterium]|nr:addiction module protein [Verrucomicrobiota bacterium]